MEKEKPLKKSCQNPVEHGRVSRLGVWTSHNGQTGCGTGFSPSRRSRA